MLSTPNIYGILHLCKSRLNNSNANGANTSGYSGSQTNRHRRRAQNVRVRIGIDQGRLRMNDQSTVTKATKTYAHGQVGRAIREGRIVNPKLCANCLANKSEAHHPDYAKPLSVVWLCRKCHRCLHPGERRKGPDVRSALEALKERRWSDADIGAELGIERSAIWRWRHGRTAPRHFMQIPQALQELLARP